MMIIPPSCAATDVTLFSLPISTYGLIAEIVLVEKGVPFELVDVEPSSAEHRERHPFGKVPVLEHRRGGSTFRIFESLAVARYVDEAFDGPALQPGDVLARATMMQWVQSVNAYLFPTITVGISKPRLFPGPEPIDEDSIATAVVNAGQQLDLVETALTASPWLAGDELTLADIFLFPVLGAVSLTPEGGPLLATRPKCVAWFESMQERESVRTTGGAARS
ncbi:MAG: glutathione S-transferase [Candidatus Binatia bacterium]|jgi:glutathione S-transferase